MDDWITAPEWTTKHGYFLQMGGFRMVCSEEESVELQMKTLRFWFMDEAYRYRSRLGDDMLEGGYISGASYCCSNIGKTAQRT